MGVNYSYVEVHLYEKLKFTICPLNENEDDLWTLVTFSKQN